MSAKYIEVVKAEIRRLEVLGVVLGMLGLTTFEPTRVGRPKLYETEAERKRAYRNRKAAKPLSIVREGQRTRPLKRVRDIDLAQKAQGQSN